MQEHSRNQTNATATLDARMFRYGFIASLIGGAIGLILGWLTVGVQFPQPSIAAGIGAGLGAGIGVKLAMKKSEVEKAEQKDP
jgi:hypothetical protein